MKAIIFTMLILLLNMTTVMSQTGSSVSFDVAGLDPFSNPTDREVRQALGQPTQYSVSEDELGGVREYRYGSQEKYDFFRYDAYSESFEFELVTPAYSLFNGRIKVGSPVSAFSNLGGGLLQKQSQNLYRFYPLGVITETYLEIRSDDKGLIIKILFFPPS